MKIGVVILLFYLLSTGLAFASDVVTDNDLLTYACMVTYTHRGGEGYSKQPFGRFVKAPDAKWAYSLFVNEVQVLYKTLEDGTLTLDDSRNHPNGIWTQTFTASVECHRFNQT
jgi:hypothetical protein